MYSCWDHATPGDNSGTLKLCPIKQDSASAYVLHSYCSYGCPRFQRAKVEIGGDLTGVVLVDIQAKCTVEYLQVYI